MIALALAPGEIQARILRIYGIYNREKLDDVPHLMSKYAGKEETLYAAIIKKYGVKPDFFGSGPASKTPPAGEPDPSIPPTPAKQNNRVEPKGATKSYQKRTAAKADMKHPAAPTAHGKPRGPSFGEPPPRVWRAPTTARVGYCRYFPGAAASCVYGNENFDELTVQVRGHSASFLRECTTRRGWRYGCARMTASGSGPRRSSATPVGRRGSGRCVASTAPLV